MTATACLPSRRHSPWHLLCRPVVSQCRAAQHHRAALLPKVCYIDYERFVTNLSHRLTQLACRRHGGPLGAAKTMVLMVLLRV